MKITSMMTNDYSYCLDINYKTEMELRAISTYLFIIIVFISYIYIHVNHYTSKEIRYLQHELRLIRNSISSVAKAPEETESSGSSGSSDSSTDTSSSESEEDSGIKTRIRFRGKRYVMN